MKIFSFDCDECDSSYLRTSAFRCNCPRCNGEMHLAAVLEVGNEVAKFIKEEE